MKCVSPFATKRNVTWGEYKTVYSVMEHRHPLCTLSFLPKRRESNRHTVNRSKSLPNPTSPTPPPLSFFGSCSNRGPGTTGSLKSNELIIWGEQAVAWRRCSSGDSGQLAVNITGKGQEIPAASHLVNHKLR